MIFYAKTDICTCNISPILPSALIVQMFAPWDLSPIQSTRQNSRRLKRLIQTVAGGHTSSQRLQCQTTVGPLSFTLTLFLNIYSMKVPHKLEQLFYKKLCIESFLCMPSLILHEKLLLTGMCTDAQCQLIDQWNNHENMR